MIKASPVGAQAAEYKYNGDGLRVEKIINGKATRYLYEYDKIVLELDEKGNETARNVHGVNPISRTIEGTTVYYMYNGHADVTALIGELGEIKATYYYDAFGNPTETTGTADNPFRYAAYQYDDESGLYYLNSRMYDPKIARFMQEDSYKGDFKDPLSLNLYSYCNNEPLMYWDPTGHWKKETVDGKTYAIAEKGDTLSGLAEEELGDASKWKDLGYTGDPTKLQIGEKIDITKFRSEKDSDSVEPVPVVRSKNIPKESDTEEEQETDKLILTDEMKKAGVKIVTVDGVEYFDFSEPINKMIWDNGQICKEQRSDGGWDYLGEVYNSLSWFHDQVNHGMAWDIKVPERWNEQLSTLRNFEILDSNNNFTKFVLNGEVITAEDLGNITYGYWGRALGFGETLIYAGGGYAAVGNNADDPRIYDPKQFYGDPENDHISIEKGIKWYNSVFKDDKPVFDPGLGTIKILFNGYDAKRNIGNTVEGVKDGFDGLKGKLPWNK